LAVWLERKPEREYFDFDDIITRLSDIYGVEDLDEWLKPTKASVHDPYTIDNIVEVGMRIIKAIEDGEMITVSYDVDSDGITSGSILIRYLKQFTSNINYVYGQRNDGHGIGVQFIPEETQLLIVVDSSTNETEVCKELFCDGVNQIIIIDHHPKTQDNPYALIVNNQLDNYPNKELSGAGMVFKVVQVLDDLLSQETHQEFIDMAGIGISGDVMSMKEKENRYFVYQALNNIMNYGLSAILEVSKIDQDNMSTQTIGFDIVPVINACARLGKIEIMIELLLEDDYSRCLELAKEAISLNKERKKITKKLTKKIETYLDTSNAVIISVEEGGLDDERGFNGLIATGIAEKYQKPTIICKKKNGICMGSARGIGSIKFKEVLESTGLFHLLEGHQGAFGIGFKEEDLDKIHNELNKKLKNVKEKVVYYDIELKLSDITFKLIEDIMKFNMLAGKDAYNTKVLIRDVEVIERKLLGKTKVKDTVKFVCENKLDILKFRTTEDFANEVKEGDLIDVICNLSINSFFNWGTRENVVSKQGILIDYKLSDKNKSKIDLANLKY